MYSEKQLREELYEKVCQCYYVKMQLLNRVVKKEISLDEFEHELRANSNAKTQEELEKQVSGAVSEVKRILDKIDLSGGMGKNPIDIAKALRKQANETISSAEDLRKALKNALNVIRPYLQEHPDDIEAIETFGWVMYDIIKSFEEEPEKYKKALSFLNENVHLCNERMINQTDDRKAVLPKCYFFSFMRIIKSHVSFTDRLFSDIIKFVETKNDFLRCGDIEFQKTARNLYWSLLDKVNNENKFLLLNTVGLNWFSAIDYDITSSNGTTQNPKQTICFAERVLSKYTKLLVSQPVSQGYALMATSLIKKIEECQKQQGIQFEFADKNLTNLYGYVGNISAAMESALRYLPAHRKEPYAWEYLAEYSDGENKLVFICSALLCDVSEELKVSIQKKAIPLFVDYKLYSSAHFEVDTFEKTYTSNKEWRIPKVLISNWKASEWYQTNVSADSREPLKAYAKKANSIIASYLPETRIFIDYVNKEKGTVSFLLKEGRRYQRGFFYIDSCEYKDIKSRKVYAAKIGQNKSKPDLYDVYELREFTETQEPYIREDHGIVRLVENAHFAFVSSNNAFDFDTFIPGDLVKRYDLHDDIEIKYEKAMSWDKNKSRVGWTMTRLI